MVILVSSTVSSQTSLNPIQTYCVTGHLWTETCVAVSLTCPLPVLVVEQNFMFIKTLKYANFMKIYSAVLELFHMYRRTDGPTEDMKQNERRII
jgi:hypothetical protein